tara:strand:- start:114 stop:296 length:183 start_codon:yes stop_codon:yes gene_type:complete
MMVQMVDSVSWISALIHETKSWSSDPGACRKSDNTFSDPSAARRDNTAIQLCRLESFGDV